VSVPQGDHGVRRSGAEPPLWNNLSPSGDVCTGALEVLGRHVAERRVNALPVVEGLAVVEQAGARVTVVAVPLWLTSSVFSEWKKLSIAASS
jgi:hypothetical protein